MQSMIYGMYLYSYGIYLLKMLYISIMNHGHTHALLLHCILSGSRTFLPPIFLLTSYLYLKPTKSN